MLVIITRNYNIGPVRPGLNFDSCPRLLKLNTCGQNLHMDEHFDLIGQKWATPQPCWWNLTSLLQELQTWHPLILTQLLSQTFVMVVLSKDKGSEFHSLIVLYQLTRSILLYRSLYSWIVTKLSTSQDNSYDVLPGTMAFVWNTAEVGRPWTSMYFLKYYTNQNNI
mgnify:CR=1 FL=1